MKTFSFHWKYVTLSVIALRWKRIQEISIEMFQLSFNLDFFFHLVKKKLDGIGPVDNRPSTTSFTTWSNEEEKKKHVWYLTCDRWQVTNDMWHVTCDMWREVNILSKFQVPSSYGLGVKVFWRYLNKMMTDWLDYLIN